MLDASAEAAPIATDRSWCARLELAFARRNGRTVMVRRCHRGPLMVQRPFYPEGPVCHTYILHPPGGVVATDRLETIVHARPGARVLLTTPASGKLYRSAGATAEQRETLRVDAGAELEWLPQETICFDGARARQATRIELHGDARVLAWEITGLGRPGAGERFTRGRLAQSLELLRDGSPLLAERLVVDPHDALPAAAWGLGGENAFGTLLGYPAGEAALAAARRELERVWRALRPAVLGREALAPRVWAT